MEKINQVNGIEEDDGQGKVDCYLIKEAQFENAK